jgi:hypothetical protein
MRRLVGRVARGLRRLWIDFSAPLRQDAPLISLLHPFVAMAYIGTIRVGYIYLSEQQSSQSMDDWIGEDYTMLWALAMGVGGVLALLGVLRATIWPARARGGLRTEAWGCGLIAVTNATYVYALNAGASQALHTITLSETFATAAALRLFVMVFEFRKIRWRTRQALVQQNG